MTSPLVVELVELNSIFMCVRPYVCTVNFRNTNVLSHAYSVCRRRVFRSYRNWFRMIGIPTECNWLICILLTLLDITVRNLPHFETASTGVFFDGEHSRKQHPSLLLIRNLIVY